MQRWSNFDLVAAAEVEVLVDLFREAVRLHTDDANCNNGKQYTYR